MILLPFSCIWSLGGFLLPTACYPQTTRKASWDPQCPSWWLHQMTDRCTRRFLNLNAIDIWAQIIIWGEVHCRKLSSTFGLYPQATSITLLPVWQSNESPNIVKCPLEDESSPIENHRYKSINKYQAPLPLIGLFWGVTNDGLRGLWRITLHGTLPATTLLLYLFPFLFSLLNTFPSCTGTLTNIYREILISVSVFINFITVDILARWLNN